MSTTQELRTQADALFADGDLDGALSRYVEIARRIDATPDALSDAGMVCIALSRIAEITEKQGRASFPAGRPSAHGVREETAPATEPKHVRDCREAWRQACMHPRDANAWRRLADAAVDAADIADAEALYGAGDYAAALERYERLLDRHPDAPEILTDMGTVCFAMGRAAESCRYYVRALEADADYEDARRNLDAACRAQGLSADRVVATVRSQSATAGPSPPLAGDDRVEILPVSILDTERMLVEEMRSISEALRKGLGWHYLLDLPWAARMLRARPGMCVLDAGAGVGLMQWWLAAQGIDVISVDRGRRWHARFHSWCRVRGLRPIDEPEGPPPGQPSPPAGRGTVTLYNQDLSRMSDLPDGSVDAIVSISALEHNDPEAMPAVVTELMRVLKPGGRLVATLGAAVDQDWFHEPSKGWCYTEATLRRIFRLAPDCPSNYERYDELLDGLKNCAELRDNLDAYYFRSGDNGMPWGKWDPKYTTVGVVKVKSD